MVAGGILEVMHARAFRAANPDVFVDGLPVMPFIGLFLGGLLGTLIGMTLGRMRPNPNDPSDKERVKKIERQRSRRAWVMGCVFGIIGGIAGYFHGARVENFSDSLMRAADPDFADSRMSTFGITEMLLGAVVGLVFGMFLSFRPLPRDKS